MLRFRGHFLSTNNHKYLGGWGEGGSDVFFCKFVDLEITVDQQS